MSPDEIKELQTQLQTMNYYHGEVTGKYTADLLAALAEYHGVLEETTKGAEESKNGFYNSLDSFKEIGQGFLGSLQKRANKATDSPYDFFNWLTLGLTGDLPSGIYAGAKDRADHSFDSVEKFTDWLTLGTEEIFTLIAGPLESQILKPSTGVGIPKLPNPPSLKNISSPRGIENLNKNPVVVTPEGLSIKFNGVHTEAKPLTQTPVQEHFNKEMA